MEHLYKKSAPKLIRFNESIHHNNQVESYGKENNNHNLNAMTKICIPFIHNEKIASQLIDLAITSMLISNIVMVLLNSFYLWFQLKGIKTY